MEERPRIRIPLTAFDKILEATGITLLLALWLGIIISYSRLPLSIPVHFNLAGKPDAYGGKFSLVILALVATILYAGLTWLCEIPHHFNYLVTITSQNAESHYRAATRIIRFIKVAIVLLFLAIIILTYLTATGVTNGVGSWFLPAIFLLFIVPVITLIWSSLKRRP